MTTKMRERALEQFEKNRFFQGKLMTPRDMQVEQEYHAERLHTLARYTMGTGIVRGLEVRDVQETQEELTVTVAPGLAIDGYGRPIVVETETSKSVPVPTNDEIYLFARHAEVSTESVPVPDADGVAGDEQTPNRAIEVFELTYQETEPEPGEPTPELELELDEDSRDPFHEIAAAYHEQYREEPRSESDPAVFVGAFERGSDGGWQPTETAVKRPLVYDTEMLFRAFASHLADTDNPHGVTVDPEPRDVPVDLDDIEGFERKLQFLQAELHELKEDRDTLNRYLMRKSLKDKERFFRDVADRFEEHSDEVSRVAQEIVTAATEGIAANAYDQPEIYREHVRELLDAEIRLGETLEGTATEDTLDGYVRAVSQLQNRLEDEASILDVAVAQDNVCEAADSLEELYDIVPDT
ncbi:hypothetical protein DV733_08235 [Halapricum salinum]|uniref:Uncharacterized protein n=2 Tax=Halapricum salinum TaxID=1457250 RepID=A0A4D6HDW1_9EURY|nr:hypothetical protein DV733_08235 [Halapricum salinum]